MNNLLRLNEENYELNRLANLRTYEILDTLSEDDYENITYLASTICQVPIAVVSFIDDKRQWFKSHHGLQVTETEKQFSFCSHAINSPQEFLIVPDASRDDRFSNNPLVTGDPNIVFYAGVPLVSEEGYGLGAVCVIDNQPRQLSETQLSSLKILSTHVMTLLKTRRSNGELKKMKADVEAKHEQLQKSQILLKQSEERLRKMSEGADVLVAVRDQDNEYTLITKSWSTFTGKSIDELMLFGWRELIHPDDRERFYGLFDQSFENRMPYSVEFRMLNAQNEYIWLLTQGSPEFRADGSFSGFISSTVDISIQKDVEKQLNLKSRTLEFTMAAGKLGSYELEINSGRMITSAQYNRNIGLEPGRQLTLSYLLTFILSDDKQIISKAFSGVVKDKLSYEMEYRLLRPGGEISWIRDCGIAMLDQSGNVHSVSGFTMNITEQRRLVAELERKAKDKNSDLSARFSNLDNLIS